MLLTSFLHILFTFEFTNNFYHEIATKTGLLKANTNKKKAISFITYKKIKSI